MLMIEWHNAIEAYAKHLEFVDRKSKNTVQAYLGDLKAYSKYFINEGIDFDLIQSEQINAYLQSLNDAHANEIGRAHV